jgi:hypothetical protein
MCFHNEPPDDGRELNEPDENGRLVVPCQCPDPTHDCQNLVIDDGSMSPVLCTPCLYGCAV